MLVYLSFVDPERPEGGRYLGSAIVAISDSGNEHENAKRAVRRAHTLKINPGGTVLFHPIPFRVEPHVPPEYRGRLLTKAELEELHRIVRPHGSN